VIDDIFGYSAFCVHKTMKRILIISDQTISFAESLRFPGISVSVVAVDNLNDSLFGRETIIILDIESLSGEEAEFCVELAREKGGRLCSLNGKGQCDEKLLTLGIACSVSAETLASDPASILSLFHDNEGGNLAVLIDNDAARCSIAESIFTLFGYRFRALSKPEDLFELKETEDLFIIHNLTMEDCELLPFVKKGSASKIFKTMPYIAFTHGTQGVTLKEINSGISRLTGYILSEEEVWSVVVFNLFRKGLYENADSFSRTIRLQENSEWAKDPVRKLFFSREAKFFTAPGAAEANHLQSANKAIASLSVMNSRMKYLSWLVRDQQKKASMAFDC
jgi:hypothetical protein